MMSDKLVKTRSTVKTMKIEGLKVLHFLVSAGLFVPVWMNFYTNVYSSANHPKADILMYVLYMLLLFIMERTYDAYCLGYRKTTDNVYSQSLSQVITGGLTWIVSCLIFMKLTNPLPLIVLCVIQFVWNIIWCKVANMVYNRLHRSKSTVVIYKDDSDLKYLSEIAELDNKFNIQKKIKDPSDYISLEKEIKGFDAIVVSGVDATLRNGLAKYCIESGIPGYFAPHVGDIIMQGARHIRSFTVPILSVRRSEPRLEYLFFKRAFDIIVSLLGIIILSPVFIATSIAIKACDHGPVFYKQVRLTKDYKQFKILKFRSMRVDAEKDGVARLSSGENDDRITPIGKIIRKFRLDELPQLFNILGGSMTIVGPRPERPEIAADYEKEMPAFGLRLQVKAGLTGYAQVYGKYNTNPHDKLEMDLLYINRSSVVEDLRLMFATVKILFLKESTEGIEEGKTNAME